jgi:hypothetical protein
MPDIPGIPSSAKNDILIWIMLGLGLAGIVGLFIYIAYMPQNKDNAGEIQKNLAIITGISAVIVGIFGVTAYIYFSANVAYLSPFVLIMTFINLFLSVTAVSAASLNISYS